jgi:CubicO group peptidase (beta-lactamase class C family)
MRSSGEMPNGMISDGSITDASSARCRGRPSCLHRLMHGDLLTPATKRAMLLPRSYDADTNAPEDSGYGLGLMIEPARPGERFGGHAGSGPGSTSTVFSALTGRRTFAASAGTDAPDTFPKLIEYLRTLL